MQELQVFADSPWSVRQYNFVKIEAQSFFGLAHILNHLPHSVISELIRVFIK